MIHRRRARGRKEPVAAGAPVVLDARNVKVTFHLKGGFLGRGAHILRAVDDVSLSVRAGETVGIVGESGSGQVHSGPRHPPASAGIRPHPVRGPEPHAARPERHAPLRRQLQVVFQDPFGSLSPRMTAGEIVTKASSSTNPASRARNATGAPHGPSRRSGSILHGATATRTNFPAASASASRSPAP